jgi:hypothetical protein
VAPAGMDGVRGRSASERGESSKVEVGKQKLELFMHRIVALKLFGCQGR